MNKFIVRLPKGATSTLKKAKDSSQHDPVKDETSTSPTTATSPGLVSGSSTDGSRRLKMQMQLDFGQKSLGERILCKKCGLLYMAHDSDDQKEHAQFCKDVQKPVSLPSLTGHQILVSSSSALKGGEGYSIVQITTGQRLHRDAIQRISEKMEQEVGTSENFIEEGRTMYLYLNEQRHVLGAVLLESVETKNVHTITSTKDLSLLESARGNEDKNEEHRSGKRPRTSSLLGIRLIWVHENHQRKGIASKLIDAARLHFMFGTTFSVKQVAFSQPTEMGFLFAKSYCGDGETVLCYSRD